jgi:repressor LexA
MDRLTPPQQETLNFLKDELTAGRPVPTLRELAAKFGYKSHRAAACHLEALKRKGFVISGKGKARSLRLRLGEYSQAVSIPLLGAIPAGFSSEREQQPEGCVTVDINTLGFKPSRTTFAVRVAGDSMIGKHICDGDIAILEHGADPRPGQIVAALIDNKCTLKTYVVKNGKPYLKAENPKYPNLIPSEELVIQGIFKALLRRAKD